MGWIKDRNECYYDYRDDRRASSEWGPSKILDSASWAYWGYGVRPYNAVMSILVIIFSFGLIYRSLVYFNFARVIRKNGRRDDEEAPTQIEQDNLDSKVALAKTDSLQSQSRISFKEALFFSTRTLLLKSPGNIRIEGMYARYAIWIQQVIFGFFVVLFIVFFNEEVQSYFKPPT
jgi:hypothetical protein